MRKQRQLEMFPTQTRTQTGLRKKKEKRHSQEMHIKSLPRKKQKNSSFASNLVVLPILILEILAVEMAMEIATILLLTMELVHRGPMTMVPVQEKERPQALPLINVAKCQNPRNHHPIPNHHLPPPQLQTTAASPSSLQK